MCDDAIYIALVPVLVLVLLRSPDTPRASQGREVTNSTSHQGATVGVKFGERSFTTENVAYSFSKINVKTKKNKYSFSNVIRSYNFCFFMVGD